MSLIPQENRAYTLAFLSLIFCFGLAALVLWKQPNQWSFVLEWFKSLVIWMVPLVIGAKELGKVVAGKFGGNSAPPVPPTPGGTQ